MRNHVKATARTRGAIIVTGTPGTGKTAFSKAFAKEIGADYIPLTRYVSKHMLFSGFDRERRSKIIDTAKTKSSLTALLSQSQRLVVIDTHVPEGIIPKKMTRKVFVLRCHPRKLETRLRGKGWSSNKIRENVLAEILDFCLISAVRYFGWPKIIQLDTSRAGLRDCVVSAKKFLLGRSSKSTTSVDWLRRLQREGLLNRYLKS